MECSVAIQYLPMDSSSEEELCRVVDAVIDYIKSTGVPYYVGPFETAIEGDFETCMKVIEGCHKAGIAAGCTHTMIYAKIDSKTEGDVLSTDQKIGKYHPDEQISGQ